MSSVEFFTMVKDHLKDGGVMVVNMNMHGYDEEGGPDITNYLSDTVASVFPNVVVADVKNSTNRELFASVDTDMMAALSRGCENAPDEGLKKQLTDVQGRLSFHKSSDLILTDDKAPVELLGMQVIDSLINDELDYYKEVYKEEGLSGLMESF